MNTPSDLLTQQLQNIRAWIGQRQLPQAAKALNQLQKLHPRDARIPLLGMRMAEVAGNQAAAVQAARRAVQLDPDWHVALTELAMQLARSNVLDEAMQVARRAVAAAPQDANVLQRALAVAERADASDDAIRWATAGLTLQPQDHRYPQCLGSQYAAQREFDKAYQHFAAALALAPDNLDVLRGAVSSALDAKNQAAAVQHADDLLARLPNDDTARYFHDIAHGRTPSTQPSTVVATLFDDYAGRFDIHLVGRLKYTAPERVVHLLLERYPDRRFNLLDLGCGTGLLGAYLGPIDGAIVGVDLSAKMIEQAQRHRVYARFYNVNVLDALRDTPAEHYEAITCLDVLVYVGDLAPVIPNAYRILKPGGHFIFTCETAQEDEPDLVLRASQRYAHKASHVLQACKQAGFDDVNIEHLETLRMESDKSLPGFIVVAHKPAATH